MPASRRVGRHSSPAAPSSSSTPLTSTAARGQGIQGGTMRISVSVKTKCAIPPIANHRKTKAIPAIRARPGRVVAGLSGSARFDSLKVMASGNIAVATLNTGYITEISPAGDIVRAVKMPDRYPTNICFGGADMRDAYVTLSSTGRLVKAGWPRPEHRLNYYA